MLGQIKRTEAVVGICYKWTIIKFLCNHSTYYEQNVESLITNAQDEHNYVQNDE